MRSWLSSKLGGTTNKADQGGAKTSEAEGGVASSDAAAINTQDALASPPPAIAPPRSLR